MKESLPKSCAVSHLKGATGLHDAMRKISDKYVFEWSDYEINVSADMRGKVEAQFSWANDEQKAMPELWYGILDECAVEVSRLLRSCFLRFLRSPRFADLNEQVQFRQREDDAAKGRKDWPVKIEVRVE